MTALRQRMIEDMQLRGLSANTQDAYVHAMKQLAQYYNRSPEEISQEELRQYLLYLKNEKGVSRSTLTVALCAIKFFYQHTLQRPWSLLAFVRRPMSESYRWCSASTRCIECWVACASPATAPV
jgi:integrase/recombinase XerD